MSDLQPPKRYRQNEEIDEPKIVKHKSKGVKSLKNSGFFTVGGFDIPFFILTMALLSIGLIMLFSASYPYALQHEGDSYYYIKRQLIFAILGVGVMLAVSKINFKVLKAIEKPLLVVTLLLLVVVLVYHTDVEGFKRWIPLGPFTLQPSDIAKFSLVLSLSVYMSKYAKQMNTLAYGIGVPVVFTLIFCALIACEHHLSCTILVLLMGGSMMLVGGSNKKVLMAFGAIAIALGIFVLIKPEVLPEYNTERIIAFLDKTYEPLDDRWQTNNSLYAIGSGGFWGVGLGNSKQKFLYVSEPQNDFIFSIVCEELGFFGSAIIVILFALLFIQGIRIAIRTKERFAALLVIGIISQVALQTIFNILVVTDSVPNTGIALPFFSYGGTAILMLMFEMGVILSISRRANQKTV